MPLLFLLWPLSFSQWRSCPWAWRQLLCHVWQAQPEGLHRHHQKAGHHRRCCCRRFCGHQAVVAFVRHPRPQSRVHQGFGRRSARDIISVSEPTRHARSELTLYRISKSRFALMNTSLYCVKVASSTSCLLSSPSQINCILCSVFTPGVSITNL